MSSLARTGDERGIELHLPVAAGVISSAYLRSPARGDAALRGSGDSPVRKRGVVTGPEPVFLQGDRALARLAQCGARSASLRGGISHGPGS
jgi:hypothetical protein